jgi:hypothetical protein
VVVGPVKQRQVVPASDACHDNMSESLVDCLFDFSKVVLAQVTTLTSTENAPEETSLLALVFVLLDLALRLLVNVFFSLLLFLELVAVCLDVKASAHNTLKTTENQNDIGLLVDHHVFKSIVAFNSITG